jgi:hypothetical protein
VSALLGRIPSAMGYQPTLATDLGGLQERITTTKKVNFVRPNIEIQYYDLLALLSYYTVLFIERYMYCIIYIWARSNARA